MLNRSGSNVLLAFVLAAFLSVFAGVSRGQEAQQQQPGVDLDYQTAAVVYMQKAAEYRALCYQAYNLAHLRLDADFEKRNVKQLPKAERKRPRAVIVDIDETVLDNSPSQARGIKFGKPFNPSDWDGWVQMRKAKAIPGAVDFLNYAVSRGVKVFYISNRTEGQKQATIDNLRSVGFKDVDASNVMMRTAESGKDARRDAVAAKYRVVLLVGDNLDDFTSAFENKSVSDRFAQTDKDRTLWGSRFIVLPNAMYGTWESAVYEFKRMSEKEKAAKRAAALELP